MALLTDATRLAAYRDALSNWAFEGYVQFDVTEQAYSWIKNELRGISLKGIKRRMHEYVAAGGGVDEVRELRPDWCDAYQFHYDLRFAIDEKPIYIETRLHYRVPLVPDESWILVVNVHAP
jgi:hypothetical protein